jgi:hypothetical protein
MPSGTHDTRRKDGGKESKKPDRHHSSKETGGDRSKHSKFDKDKGPTSRAHDAASKDHRKQGGSHHRTRGDTGTRKANKHNPPLLAKRGRSMSMEKPFSQKPKGQGQGHQKGTSRSHSSSPSSPSSIRGSSGKCCKSVRISEFSKRVKG